MCEKCQDRGFTEENHGLIMILCDCGKARELAKGQGIPCREDDQKETFVEVVVEANAFANALLPRLGSEINDSINRTERDNQPIGSTDTSKPKQPQKPKAKKRAGKRTG